MPEIDKNTKSMLYYILWGVAPYVSNEVMRMVIQPPRRIDTFEDLYSNYYQQVVGYLNRKIGNYSDAEDLASEIFEYCYKQFPNYDPSKASVQTWLYVIVNSRYKNYLRDHRVSEDIDDYADIAVSDAMPMEQAAEIQEERQMLARVLEQLTERERKIVVYKYFKDMSAAQIAEKMELSEGNVRQILFRTLSKMQKLLNNLA